ncbi:pyridoxamine 5'-phosphate oxidase family protein [Streptomyces sp. NPDC059866]|uniref:pyridoxamine 5'-phosphate oxidase family protein n=1 Tax=Streptomyces sp. NPDC059866 TaxID=3346978 RepID=UPI003661040A
MTRSARPLAGFHDGELAVQQRAGVTAAAARLSGMLAPAQLRGGLARFLSARTFAALTARDQAGRLWISPLTGPAGFLNVTSVTALSVRTAPAPGDPLHALPAGQPVGLLVVEFATRRRFRLNGNLTAADQGTLQIDVEQAYGNCPQYIQHRHLAPTPALTPGPEPVRHGSTLTPDDVELIRQSDTFLIGTTHPTRGSDASHRGGPPGFVRVEDNRLWWPDYWGNNMFNTLGNLDVDPTAALLFCDFATGHTLHLSGRAALEWTRPGIPGDDDRTGRRVHFIPQKLTAGRLLPLQADAVTAAPDNPSLTDRTPAH